MNNQDIFRLRQLGLSALFSVVLYFLLAAIAQAGAHHERGLLWEISKPGQQSSYLFGTIHSEDPGVLNLPDPVRDVFSSSSAAVFEVKMDMDAMIYSSQAMLMTDGRLLSDVIGRSLFNKTAESISARGVPEVVLEHMKPWAAAVTLSMPASETGQVLDLVLYQQAIDSGKQVYGLESIQEQLNVFDSMPEKDQVALLKDAVENFHDIDAMHVELIAAWKQRDLARLMAINDEAMKSGDQRLAADFQQRLLDDRNHLMVERMQTYLKQGNAFIGIGALHLPGEAGVLNLLERQGYTVKVVY